MPSKPSFNQLSAFAVCANGLEDCLINELNTFQGVECIKKNKGGVNFNANAEVICKLNLWARIPSRILIQLGKTQIKNADELLEFALRINWGKWFLPTNSFRIDVNSTGRMPKTISANYAALKFKDGVCDRFRSEFNGARPTVDTKSPDIRIWLHFVNSLATASIDTSGEPLFKRGWRQSKGIAPIKENLVSALLSMTNWNVNKPLIDPMCGSGTFVIEAMQRIAKLPANYLPNNIRKFSSENFSPDSPFRNVGWKILREEAFESWQNQEKIVNHIPLIVGCDSDIEMIDIAKKNASLALPNCISKLISWEVGDFYKSNFIDRKIFSAGVLVTNPPFGMRIEFGKTSKKEFIEQMGSVLKKNFPNWTVWILTDEKKFSSIIRLRPNEKFVVFNGDISCNWLSFKMVTGHMKDENEN